MYFCAIHENKEKPMNVQKKILSFMLALVMLCGMIGPLGKNSVQAAENATTASGTKIMNAAFTDETIEINGIPGEQGWSLHAPVSENALWGALWDMENLYIAIRNTDKERLTVTLNGVKLTVDNAEIKSATNKKSSEYKVSFETLGVTFDDFGKTIDASIKVGASVWSGKIVLTSTKWLATDTPTRRIAVSSSGSSRTAIVDAYALPTSNQGVKKTTTGYNFFDKYNPTGLNPRSVRTAVTLNGKDFAGIGEKGTNVALEFSFAPKQMPVYDLGMDADFSPNIASCGLNIGISREGHLGTAPMGIMNTNAGLVFIARSAERDYTYVLNREVGDTVRIGIIWTAENDLILSVDGKRVATFPNVAFISRYVPKASETTSVSFACYRSIDSAQSEADNFDFDVFSIAIGTNSGDSILDSLTFESLRKRNADPDNIFSDLFLAAKHKADPFPKALDLTWESSDPAVIDPATGKLTVPEGAGKSVTMTATMPAIGVSKSFDLFVPGTAKTEDILIKSSDRVTMDGKGVVPEDHMFTLDKSNGSIIRDLKETKTVNVIVLKDGDDITRLNESMLTIWTSDDNETYTQAGNFKMLRAGQYTYLYDFEATGRYIKVHSTVWLAADADFTGPVDGMIDAYYANVFGDGNAPFATITALTVENTGDTTAYDTVHTISAADAGVKCVTADYADVRFYLGSELLYHYFDGEKFLVRIPKIAANSSVTLTILSGNASAMNIANKEYVHEVVYGTREVYLEHGEYMDVPNGMLYAFIDGGNGSGPFQFKRSFNEGRNFWTMESATGSNDVVSAARGALYDPENGRIVVQGSSKPHTDGVNSSFYQVSGFVYSDNLGGVWRKATYTVEGDPFPLFNSYGQPIKLSSSDGEDGPGVDYVVAFGGYDFVGNGYDPEKFLEIPEAELHKIPCVNRVAYTTDCGKTWVIGPSVIRDSDSVAISNSIREVGITESCVWEAEDGTLIMMSRNQYPDEYHFAVSYSYDHGLTWQEEAGDSNIYGTNTEPVMFDYDGSDLVIWGGNTTFGQTSFRRYPINIGVSNDNLKTFGGIQDVTSRTAFQGMNTGTRMDITNPFATQIGDAVILCFSGEGGFTMRIDDFGNYFFRTKGAYDSFENTTTEYEGWAIVGGSTETSDAHATDGSRSMLIAPETHVVRSIPSLSTGTVSFDLWIDDVAKTDFEFEFESAFGLHYGDATPAAFRLTGNKLTWNGSDKAVSVDLKNGWNTFVFDIDLASNDQYVKLSVNGGTATEAPIMDGELHNYICFISFNLDGKQAYNLDSFLVTDNDPIVYSERLTEATLGELTEVSSNLKDTCKTVDEAKTVLTTKMSEEMGEAFKAENAAFYHLNLQYSLDDGKMWTPAALVDIPLEGATVRIDYPAGTSASTHAFKMIALYDERSFRHEYSAGDLDTLLVREGTDGLYVRISGSCPVMLAWEESIDEPSAFDPSTVTPGTDNDPQQTDTTDTSSSLWIYIGIGAAVAVAIIAVIVVALKRKKKSA